MFEFDYIVLVMILQEITRQQIRFLHIHTSIERKRGKKLIIYKYSHTHTQTCLLSR
jgi:hypothetical protein